MKGLRTISRLSEAKRRISAGRSSLIFLISLTSFTQQPHDASQAMPAGEAFQILKELNDKSALFPESLMGMSGKYDALSPENCFGLEPSEGWKLVGESSGRNNYGISFRYSGDPSPTIQIGFLYSNSNFLIADKTMPAGAYAVLARTEVFQLTGNAGTYHLERNRQVPDARTEQIPLPNKLTTSLFEKKSREGPRFSLAQDGDRVLIAIGENKFLIRKK